MIEVPAPHVRHRREHGLVLLAVLLFILVTTLAASSLVVMHTTQLQREKEEELLFIGGQFRKAITSYYNTIPAGGARALPPSLEELVNDSRFPRPVHHLRRLYPDPMTGRPDWEIIYESGGVVGVKSRSGKPTIKKTGFAKDFEHFEGKDSYSDWSFSIQQPLR